MPERCASGNEGDFFKVGAVHRGMLTGQHNAKLILGDFVLNLHKTHECPTEITQIPKLSIHQPMDVASSYDLPSIFRRS
jgi:hypothetical protein